MSSKIDLDKLWTKEGNQNGGLLRSQFALGQLTVLNRAGSTCVDEPPQPTSTIACQGTVKLIGNAAFR